MNRFEVENQVEKVIKRKLTWFGVEATGYTFVITSVIGVCCFVVLLVAQYSLYSRLAFAPDLKQNSTTCRQQDKNIRGLYDHVNMVYYDVGPVNEYIAEVSRILHLNRVVATITAACALIVYGSLKLHEYLEAKHETYY